MRYWLDIGLDALAMLFILLVFPIPIFWLTVHPAIHFWRRFGNRSFWVALPVWAFTGAALLLFRERIFAERVGRNALTWTAGLLLLAVGIWLGRQVDHTLGIRRLVGLPEMNPGDSASGIVRSGVYALVRHPRYVSYMLTFLALGLLTGARGIFLVAIITILLYLFVAPLEERELREHYGEEYERYAPAVPRFVPRLRRTTKPSS